MTDIVNRDRLQTRNPDPASKRMYGKGFSMPKSNTQSGVLVGWRQIARFLSEPISVAERSANSGMPVIHEGRRVQASPEELNRWLGREAAEPVQIATENTDLSAELKRGPVLISDD
jgi:hypothetical protein